jgi:hypothetical protein
MGERRRQVYLLDPRQLSPETIAVTFALAAQIAVQATGRSTRLQENLQIAQLRIDEAASAAANAEHVPFDVLPDWLQARGTGVLALDPFFYPTGSFNIATAT